MRDSLDHLRDNPIWSSLTRSRHSALARRNGAAARYRDDVAQFAAVAEANPAAVEDLADLVDPGDFVLVMGLEGLEDAGPPCRSSFFIRIDSSPGSSRV